MKFIVLSIFFIASCATDQNWLKEPPLTVKNDSSAVPLEFCIPSEEFIKNNILSLEKKEYVELSYKEIHDECSQYIFNKKPYLFRSLIVNKYGDYSVFGGQDYLWIDYSTLAKRGSKAKKSAVIIFLKSAPHNLYVTSHFDE